MVSDVCICLQDVCAAGAAVFTRLACRLSDHFYSGFRDVQILILHRKFNMFKSLNEVEKYSIPGKNSTREILKGDHGSVLFTMVETSVRGILFQYHQEVVPLRWFKGPTTLSNFFYFGHSG